ncbi:MAG: NERD domain-containing protein [Saprospiraceae bacterium]
MKIKPILLGALLTVLPLLSFATDFYIATLDLNVRVGAGARCSVSFTLKKGSEVELLSKGNNWYNIKYFGKTGYASSKYLRPSRTTLDTQLNTFWQSANNFLVIPYIGLLVFICFIVYRKIRDKQLLESVTSKRRGTKSERDLVLKLLKYGISEQYIFHDLYVEKKKNEFSQTDLVVVTKVGILVIEVKDYSGWIFGAWNQQQWTKVLAYGKQKFQFYNPIMQNTKHIAELERHLNKFGIIPFYSIVVFYGNCEFKNINFVPQGTYIVKAKRALEVVSIILRDNSLYRYSNENEVIRVLREAVTNGADKKNQIQHIENINEMLGTNRIFE